MSGGLVFAGLVVGAFAVWALILALIWRAFRNWQYLVDLSAQRRTTAAGRGGDRGIFGQKEDGAWDEWSRPAQMALRARIVVFGLPPGERADMAPFARRFRASVLGVLAVSAATAMAVAVLEPALWGAARLYLLGLAVWAGLHLAVMAGYGNRKRRA
ncbi:MAG: hypothetical protein ACWA5A_18395 [Marinibacterium sp.]